MHVWCGRVINSAGLSTFGISDDYEEGLILVSRRLQPVSGCCIQEDGQLRKRTCSKMVRFHQKVMSDNEQL